MTSTAELLAEATDAAAPAGLLDEGAKREIRRAALTAVCVPGYQVPFGSREMPVARGWGSGGLQVTLAVIGAEDTVKVIDQGDDAGVNATNLRRMIAATTGCGESADTRDATVIQTRHRIPEEAPARRATCSSTRCRCPSRCAGWRSRSRVCARMHAEGDYAAMWVSLYEDIVRNGMITRTTGYPVLVAGRYVMATTPIPRWDVPRLHRSEHVNLFGAGREKRIYAVPPHTDVVPLTFDDVPFEVEHTPGAVCKLCGSDDVFLVEAGTGGGSACSDTEWCARVRAGDADLRGAPPAGPAASAAGPGATGRSDGRGARSPDTASGSRCPTAPNGCCGWTRSARCTARAASTRSRARGRNTAPPSARPRGPIVAAWDVSFDVAPGEALGVIGESGSGKSTVLSCVIGDERATAGSVRLATVDGGRTDLLALPDAQRQAAAHRRHGRRAPEPRRRARPAGERGRQHRRAAHRGGLARLPRHPRPGSRAARPRRGAAVADGRPGRHVLRRHAPARADRQGAGHRAAGGAARRADHGPRRVGRRRGARPAARSARRAERRRSRRQPRLLGDRVAHRPRRSSCIWAG